MGVGSFVVHRAQFGQELVAVGNGRGRGRVDGGNCAVAQVQALHARDDTGRGRAQDFRVVKRGRLLKSASSTPGDRYRPTRGRNGRRAGWQPLADGLHQQLLLATVRIALDARCACRQSHIRMPGTVSEVSATLVASTCGGRVGPEHRSCSACDRRANSGSISAPRMHRLCDRCLRRWSVSRISRSPAGRPGCHPPAIAARHSSSTHRRWRSLNRSRGFFVGR